MIIAAVDAAPQASGRIRPVNPGRDMGAIADLIEIAFSGELEQAGSALIADLRHLAVLGPLLTIVDRVTPFASGYVWEEGGRVLGNVTVTPEGPRVGRWFISNVAVHPQWQGHGIGRRLVEAALASIRREGGRRVLLQVRSNNEPAQRLYRRFGFSRFDTLVELLRPGLLPALERPRLPARRLKSGDWAALLSLARAATPPEVQRVRGVEERAFRPTLSRRLQEWLDACLVGRQTIRWGLEEHGVLVAVVSILTQVHSTPARLDLAVRPEARGPLEGPLADLGLAALSGLRPRSIVTNVSMSHPEAVQALQARSFMTVRSLDQLVLELGG